MHPSAADGGGDLRVVRQSESARLSQYRPAAVVACTSRDLYRKLSDMVLRPADPSSRTPRSRRRHVTFAVGLLFGSGIAAALLSALTTADAHADAPTVYSAAGSYTFTVPAGWSVARFDVSGAAGGGGAGAAGGPGGLGGESVVTVAVTAGQTYQVTVGAVAGGGAGGSGGRDGLYVGGAGGGASDIRLCASAGSCGLADRLVVGGGGGGGGAGSYFASGSPTTGGAGGSGTTVTGVGQNGGIPAFADGKTGGGGGSATAGGGGGAGDFGGSANGSGGGLGVGGAGGSGAQSASSGYAAGGGGGGGDGYYGGGGGGTGYDASGPGGGGGSGYTTPSALLAAFPGATQSGDGKVVINQVSSTSTTLTSSANPSVPNQQVTLTATVSPVPDGGTVAFSDGGTTIAACAARPVSTSTSIATCTQNYPSPASHSVTAAFGGTNSFTASTAVALTETVHKAATTTTIASSLDPSVSNQSVTFTATTLPVAPGTGQPTGTVAFSDGATVIAACASQPVNAASGVATCEQTYATPANHSITAVYSGDGNFMTSTSNAVNQVVNSPATNTALQSSDNPSVSGQAVTYTATVTGLGLPSGTVTFKDGGTTITACANQAVTTASGVATCGQTYATPASHSISAVYSGDSTFLASTSTVLNQIVNNANTSTTVASSVDPSVSGQSATFTATVLPTAPGAGHPTGTMAFSDGGSAIAACAAQAVNSGTGTATCGHMYPVPGSHAITAVYSGDGTFNTSTSGALTQVINKADTSTAVTSSVSPSVSGQRVTLTASVLPAGQGAGQPSGTVVFSDGGVAISSCAAQAVNSTTGTATCSQLYATPGSHPITAVYSGDGSFNTSTSSAFTQVIDKADTATTVTSSANPSVSGQPVTLTATVSPVGSGAGHPTGTVAFSDGGTAIPTCATQAVNASTGTATCPRLYATPGSHSITAVYSGDDNFLMSGSSAFGQVVDKADTATTVVSSVNPSVSGQSVTFTARVLPTAPGAGLPTGTVAFSDGGTPIAACATQTVTSGTGIATCSQAYATPGSHVVTAAYSGDGSFLTSMSSPVTQVVNKAATSSVVISSVNPSVSGQSVTFTATVQPTSPGAGHPTGAVAFSDGATPITACAAQAVSPSTGTATCVQTYPGPSSHSLSGVYSGDGSFLASSASALSQVVNKADTATALTSSANPSVSGQSVTFTATVVPTAPGAGQPAGTVTFKDGATTIATCASQAVSPSTGTATCVQTYASPTGHSLTAVYSGDSNFRTSTSSALSQTVNRDSTTTSLVADPVGSTGFGHAVTFTATVAAKAPGAGSPTGTTAFTVDGTFVGTVGVKAGEMSSIATAALSPGSHVIGASYSGDGSFLSSSQTTNYVVTCTSTVTGSHSGSIVATGDSVCLVNATATGSISVQKGTSLAVVNSTISGGILGQSSPNAILICGSHIGGGAGVVKASGLVIIGDPGDARCAVNVIIGSLTLQTNTNGVEAIGNTVGSLVNTGNSGSGPYPGDVTTITGNHR